MSSKTRRGILDTLTAELTAALPVRAQKNELENKKLAGKMLDKSAKNPATTSSDSSSSLVEEGEELAYYVPGIWVLPHPRVVGAKLLALRDAPVYKTAFCEAWWVSSSDPQRANSTIGSFGSFSEPEDTRTSAELERRRSCEPVARAEPYQDPEIKVLQAAHDVAMMAGEWFEDDRKGLLKLLGDLHRRLKKDERVARWRKYFYESCYDRSWNCMSARQRRKLEEEHDRHLDARYLAEGLESAIHHVRGGGRSKEEIMEEEKAARQAKLTKWMKWMKMTKPDEA